jgi:predicted alpha/beta superfamily hydrolase
MKSGQKVLTLILLCQVLVQNSSDLQAATPFVMPNSVMHPISTDSTRNKDYLLYVHLPESYNNKDLTNKNNAKSKQYPVLYLLDPWWDFPVVAGAHSGLVFDGVIPEMIIVGIGYADENADVNRLRETDYTPAPVPGDDNMGDGKAFLAFIESSVIPYVEETYRVDKRYRVLAGSSYGGLFTLFALFEKPALFQGHIAITPAVSWSNRWLFGREAQFYQGKNTGKPPTLESRLYMSVGDADQLENFTNESIAFSYLLKNRPYQGLDYKFELRANEHHASVKLGSFSQGLAHAFSGYPR